MFISDNIKYIGCDDLDIDLFESQYSVKNGVSYNSYVIFDEKIAVMDTVDKRKKNEWLANLNNVLNGKTVDYLIVSHLEPDHSSAIKDICELYPNMKLVMSVKASAMLPNFYQVDNLEDRVIAVKENDTLSLGKHTLKFIMAPMVHWPEVMVEYEVEEKILFSADAFGKFGALANKEEWIDEARRYYLNIVGKYGSPVQTLLKKASTLDINIIAPLHGPVLTENIGYYINLYNIWSSYQCENDGLLIVSASIHGNTYNAAKYLFDLAIKNNINAKLIDITRYDLSLAVSEAFMYKNMVLLAPTYDGYIFTPMEDFLMRLSHKGYQNRNIGLIENGSWAPMANKLMEEKLNSMKNITIFEPKITIKTTLSNDNKLQMEELIKNLK